MSSELTMRRPISVPEAMGRRTYWALVIALVLITLGAAVACLWFISAPQTDPLVCKADPPFYLRGTARDCSTIGRTNGVYSNP